MKATFHHPGEFREGQRPGKIKAWAAGPGQINHSTSEGSGRAKGLAR